MLQVRYYLGLNDKDLKKQVIDNETARSLIAQVLSNHELYGATLYDANGLWMGERENTIIIELVMDGIFINEDMLSAVGYALRAVFNQATVLMTMTKLEAVKYFDYI